MKDAKIPRSSFFIVKLFKVKIKTGTDVFIRS